MCNGFMFYCKFSFMILSLYNVNVYVFIFMGDFYLM